MRNGVARRPIRNGIARRPMRIDAARRSRSAATGGGSVRPYLGHSDRPSIHPVR